MFGFGRKSMGYTPDVKESRRQCCLCQSWRGERRYDARVGRVHYELSSSVDPCAMNFRRPGAYNCASCRGYVKWCELP